MPPIQDKYDKLDDSIPDSQEGSHFDTELFTDADRPPNNNITKKGIIFVILSICFIFNIDKIFFSTYCIFSVHINWLAFHVIYPILVLVSIYFWFNTIPYHHSKNIEYPHIWLRPIFRYPIFIVISILQGVLMVGLVYYFPLAIAMNILNHQTVTVESSLIEYIRHNRSLPNVYICDVFIPYEETGDVISPGKHHIYLYFKKVELHQNYGDKVLLIGRKSSLGLVIEKIIKKP